MNYKQINWPKIANNHNIIISGIPTYPQAPASVLRCPFPCTPINGFELLYCYYQFVIKVNCSDISQKFTKLGQMFYIGRDSNVKAFLLLIQVYTCIHLDHFRKGPLRPTISEVPSCKKSFGYGQKSGFIKRNISPSYTQVEILS